MSENLVDNVDLNFEVNMASLLFGDDNLSHANQVPKRSINSSSRRSW